MKIPRVPLRVAMRVLARVPGRWPLGWPRWFRPWPRHDWPGSGVWIANLLPPALTLSQSDLIAKLHRRLSYRFQHERLGQRVAMGVGVPTPHRVVPPRPQRRRSHRRRDRLRGAIAFLLVALLLTAALGQQFYRQPELRVDTLAPRTIIAPRDLVLEDQETTAANRNDARNGATPVLVPAATKNAKIQTGLDRILEQAGRLRAQAGPLPFLPTDALSTATQISLRQMAQGDWDTVRMLTALDQVTTPPPWEQWRRDNNGLEGLSVRQQQVVRELITVQQGRDRSERLFLLSQIEQARSRYRRVRQDLAPLITGEAPRFPEDLSFLNLSDSQWGETQQGLRRVLGRMLAQGIAPGVPPDVLQEASRLQVRHTVPLEAETFATHLLTAVLESNLETEPERTRQKAEDAARRVPPVMVSIKAGEVIVAEGERIDRAAFVLLDGFNLSQRRLNPWGLAGFGLFWLGAIALFLAVEQSQRPPLRGRDFGLILCLALAIAALIPLGLAPHGLPAVGLLLGSFYSFPLGSLGVAILTLALPLGTQGTTLTLWASGAAALVSSWIAPRLRSREELALLGIGAALTQGAVYLFLTWMLNPVNLATWYLPLASALKQASYGLGASILALGISPYLEHVFDLVTPIRLAELANPNRPLLKRLATEAPGTFQHTLFVASLAEAAAKALNCNVELVRAGTLYHDIGKMHDPQGFIENQMGGPNKHDTLNDPWISTDIIRKHVTEGLAMARRCRLPKALQAFIPEHQGTMLISYFYHQAQTLEAKGEAPATPVREADFRYDGPIPQSPETGIVMLADSCEAALRSLKEATPEEALLMVNKILRARWQDQQLVDSGLTREHMAIIAQVFVTVWQQYHHKRIAYPKGSLAAIAAPPGS